MTCTKRICVAVCTIAFSVFSMTAWAQDDNERTVEQYACKEIIREGGSQRDAAIAFLHGFLLGQSGSSKFNLEELTKQTDAFIDRCLDNPNEVAMEVMVEVKK